MTVENEPFDAVINDESRLPAISRRRLLQALGAGGLLLAGSPLLAACGSSSPAKASSGGSGGAATATTTTGPSAAVKLDPTATLRCAFHLAPTNMDPLQQDNGLENGPFLWPLYDTLTYIDPKGDIQPMLAESWSYSTDGLTLTMNLRSDVKFHDGTSFDASAVKTNLDRLLGMPTSPVHTQVKNVSSVDVISPTQVAIHLSTADASLPGAFGLQAGAMVSPHALATKVDITTKDGGSGAYVLVDYQSGDHAFYERFDGYWDPSAAGAKRLEMHVLADGQARLNGLVAKSYDLVYLTPTQFKTAENDGFGTVKAQTLWYITIYLNRTRGDLGNENVRAAIAHAIDRPAIAESIYFGLANPISSIFPSSYWAADPSIGPNFFNYDPALSKQLLEKAGLAGKVSFDMIFAAGSDPYPQFAELLQQEMKAVGINMTIKPIEISDLAVDFGVQHTSDALIGGAGQAVDPTLLFDGEFLPTAFLNVSGVGPAGLDAAIAKVQATTTQADRIAPIHQAAEIIANNVLDIPIVQPDVLFAYDKDRISGYSPSLLGVTMVTRGVGITAK